MLHTVQSQHMIALGDNQKCCRDHRTCRCRPERAENNRPASRVSGRSQGRCATLRARRGRRTCRARGALTAPTGHTRCGSIHREAGSASTQQESPDRETVARIGRYARQLRTAGIETERLPHAAMTHGCCVAEEPLRFSIDDDLELRAADKSKKDHPLHA